MPRGGLSFAVGLCLGALLAFLAPRRRLHPQPRRRRRATPAATSSEAAPHFIRPLPDAGDLAVPGALARALAVRATQSREIIFMLTDDHHVRLALNLLLNLDELKLHHHLIIASRPEVCAATWARAQQIGLSLGCGHSSFLHRGSSARIDAGLDAYNIEDTHVYHLWWQRWFFLSEAVGLGYRVLSLDTDVSLRANPYPLFHGPLAHHDLITGLDTDQALRPFYFPAANVGLVYARGPPGGGAHWVLSESRRRLEQLLQGEIVPLPEQRGVSQQVVWDQDTFKDVLETAAFTPAAPSYRHAQGHCMGRHIQRSVARLAPSLPSGWSLRIEQLHFFRNTSRPPLPSAWLPLHVKRSASAESAAVGVDVGPETRSHSGGSAGAPAARMATRWISSKQDGASVLGSRSVSSCNGSGIDGVSLDARWDPWTQGAEGVRSEGSVRSGSFAALPMWIFSTYHICPHGDVCDGRWGWAGPPPVVVGHLVGVKCKFWILRMLGWWHYDAARPLPDGATASDRARASGAGGGGRRRQRRVRDNAPGGGDSSSRSGGGGDSGSRLNVTPVFPQKVVRPLVLRGHRLTVGTTSAGIAAVRLQLVRLVLVALALGRRAVIPMVQCDIPVAETPVAMRNYVALLKLTDRTLCDGDAARPTWAMAPTIAPESSHEAVRTTIEMTRMGDYAGVMKWPPPKEPSCCQVVPELRCVDKYGDRGELRDEVMLCERDYAYMLREEREALGAGVDAPVRPAIGAAAGLSVAVVKPTAPLTLADLAIHAEARTLVVDLSASPAEDDALALLPATADAVKQVEAWLLQPERLPVGSRKCVQVLLGLAAGTAQVKSH